MKKIFSFCSQFLLGHRCKMVVLLILVVVYAGLSVLIPMVTGDFIDFLTRSKNVDELVGFCCIFAIISISAIIFNFSGQRLMIHLNQKLNNKLLIQVISRIQRQSLIAIRKCNMAYLTKRLSVDSASVFGYYFGTVQKILLNCIKLVIPFAALIIYNGAISVVIFVLIILYIITYALFKKPLYSAQMSYKEYENKYFDSAHEQLVYCYFVRAHGLLNTFIQRFITQFDSMFKTALKLQIIEYSFSGLDSIIGLLGNLTMFLIGGNSVLNGSMSIGQLTVLLSYFTMILASVSYFFNLGRQTQEALVSYDRLMSIITSSCEADGEKTIERLEDIKIEGLSIGYGDDIILEDLTLNFHKGKIYGIKGSNGAGKSTLINILLGFHKNDYTGSVKYNDICVRDLALQQILRYKISYSEQEPDLITGTLEYNVFLNDHINSVDLFRLKEMARLFGMDDIISRYIESDMNLGEKANDLSGGEKKKISLIRVLLEDPDVIILDEPSISLDANSVKALKNELQRRKLSKIIILASHEEEILDICDEVLLIKHCMSKMKRKF